MMIKLMRQLITIMIEGGWAEELVADPTPSGPVKLGHSGVHSDIII